MRFKSRETYSEHIMIIILGRQVRARYEDKAKETFSGISDLLSKGDLEIVLNHSIVHPSQGLDID